MGRHSKPSRIQLPHARPSIAATAAAPTLAGVVAAFVLSQPGTSAAPRADAPAPGSAPHGAAAETASSSTVSEAQLLAAARRAVAPKAAAAPAISYTVQPGDTLSSIAAHFYHNAAAWPALFWANHGGGSGAIQWADDIHSGQVLTIPREPAQIPSPPAQLAPAYSPRHASTTPVVAQSPSPPAQAPAQPVWPTSDGVYTGPVPGGAFGQCVVSRESGGQPQVMNSSGHYGLYQFSASTWAEYGGNPADFGHASVAEQNQVFANALAAGGENNWAPYDGC